MRCSSGVGVGVGVGVFLFASADLSMSVHFLLSLNRCRFEMSLCYSACKFIIEIARDMNVLVRPIIESCHLGACRISACCIAIKVNVAVQNILCIE